MRFTIVSMLLIFSAICSAQNVLPFVDFNYYFRSFEDGQFNTISLQQIQNYKAGDNVVAFYDNRNNLQVYDGADMQQVSALPVDYFVSDNLMAWHITETLNIWDAGELKTLSFNCREFEVKDSIIVFTDYRFKTLNVYYDGEVTTLVTDIKDVPMPDFVGENIIAYRDNGNVYKVFWHGEVYELGAWHNPIQFKGDTDILAFNDPMTGTFAIFEEGEFKDLEDFHMGKYKAGNGIVLYENINGDLYKYEDGETVKLTNFGASMWDVKDNAAIWVENGFTYAMIHGEKVEIARFVVTDFLLKNSVVAFRDLLGGVSAYCGDKVISITTQRDANFSIFGNSVLVEQFNRSFVILQEGKIYRP